ncbi:hypothetical protein [Flexibacterium corallicola]|uniref:hypothetical protein n=1 Tax=Flexibacterium corallicola TaxID=3037259 RepID=UPI00286F3381|nr:hypothetical protein [Pseudovibrio sp. M1P-2-3]
MSSDSHQQLQEIEPRDLIEEIAQNSGGDTISDQEVSIINAALTRIEALIDAENEALAHNKPVDLEETAFRKNNAMLELERAGEMVTPDNLPTQIADRLAKLRDSVEMNLKLLSAQLDAVRSVSDRISSKIRELESDGTYGLDDGKF